MNNLNELKQEQFRIENILNGKKLLKKKYRKNMKYLNEQLSMIIFKINEMEK